MSATRTSLVVFLTLAPLTAARAADPLPQAPEGVHLRAVVTFAGGDQEPVRIAPHPTTGRLYVLGAGGDVSLLDAESGSKRRVLAGSEYIEQPKRQELNIPLPV